MRRLSSSARTYVEPSSDRPRADLDLVLAQRHARGARRRIRSIIGASQRDRPSRCATRARRADRHRARHSNPHHRGRHFAEHVVAQVRRAAAPIPSPSRVEALETHGSVGRADPQWSAIAPSASRRMCAAVCPSGPPSQTSSARARVSPAHRAGKCARRRNARRPAPAARTAPRCPPSLARRNDAARRIRQAATRAPATKPATALPRKRVHCACFLMTPCRISLLGCSFSVSCQMRCASSRLTLHPKHLAQVRGDFGIGPAS